MRSYQNPQHLYRGSKEDVVGELKAWVVERRKAHNNFDTDTIWEMLLDTVPARTRTHRLPEMSQSASRRPNSSTRARPVIHHPLRHRSRSMLSSSLSLFLQSKPKNTSQLPLGLLNGKSTSANANVSCPEFPSTGLQPTESLYGIDAP